MTFSTHLIFPLDYEFDIPPIVIKVIAKEFDHRSILIFDNNNQTSIIKLNQANNFTGYDNIGIKSKHQDIFGLNSKSNQTNLEFKFEFSWSIDDIEAKKLKCFDSTSLGCPMIDYDQMNKSKEINSIVKLPNLCESGICQCEIEPIIDVISQDFEYIVGGENPFVFTIHVKNLGSEPGFGLGLELFSDEYLGIPVGYDGTMWKVQNLTKSKERRGDIIPCDKNCNDVSRILYIYFRILRINRILL